MQYINKQYTVLQNLCASCTLSLVQNFVFMCSKFTPNEKKKLWSLLSNQNPTLGFWSSILERKQRDSHIGAPRAFIASSDSEVPGFRNHYVAQNYWDMRKVVSHLCCGFANVANQTTDKFISQAYGFTNGIPVTKTTFWSFYCTEVPPWCVVFTTKHLNTF